MNAQGSSSPGRAAGVAGPDGRERAASACMTRAVSRFVRHGDVSIAVTDLGGDGPPLLLLHGLAGSSRELLPTAAALADSFRVVLIDQRGHGRSTRRPDDLSREAFVSDVVAVIEELGPGQRWTLVGQSMGAHTAFLVAATHPQLVDRLVMLEGHVAGDDPGAAAALGRYFASWPVPFADEDSAREVLGSDAVVDAWIVDMMATSGGLVPRFDADILERTIAAVHEPRWAQWEALQVTTLVVFAADGMFSGEDKDELIRRRPQTDRIDLGAGSHDAHLDAFEAWVEALQAWLGRGGPPSAT